MPDRSLRVQDLKGLDQIVCSMFEGLFRAKARPVRLRVAQAGCDLLAGAEVELIEDVRDVMMNGMLEEHEL